MQENAIAAAADIELLPIYEPECRPCDAAHQLAYEISIPMAAERVRKSLALIDRQMNVLSTQARQWRAAAMECKLNAALSGITEIHLAMEIIAESYELMAYSAERHYGSYLKKRVLPAVELGFS